MAKKDPCEVCGKTVYFSEKLSADEKVAILNISCIVVRV